MQHPASIDILRLLRTLSLVFLLPSLHLHVIASKVYFSIMYLTSVQRHKAQNVGD